MYVNGKTDHSVLFPAAEESCDPSPRVQSAYQPSTGSAGSRLLGQLLRQSCYCAGGGEVNPHQIRRLNSQDPVRMSCYLPDGLSAKEDAREMAS